jgi:hypothetical protein
MPGQQEVSAFIRSTFPSVWSLELMVFLRDNRERAWTREEMIAALRGSDEIVAQSLARLAAAQLIETAPDGFAAGAVCYRPVTPALDELVAAAEALHARSPAMVRRWIVAGSGDAAPIGGGAVR